MKLNVKLLERVKKEILAEPRKVNMQTWKTTKRDEWDWNEFGSAHPPCGAVGCIAGWAIMLNNRRARPTDYEGSACKILGIPYDLYKDDLAGSLFMVEKWPDNLRDAILKSTPGTKKYARIVARRIDLFIKEHKDEDLSL